MCDSKQFNRIRSNAMAEASMEHRNRLKKINKLDKELEEAGSIISELVEEYALRNQTDDGNPFPWEDQPPEIQRAMGFLIEVINPK